MRKVLAVVVLILLGFGCSSLQRVERACFKHHGKVRCACYERELKKGVLDKEAVKAMIRECERQ